MVGGGGGRGHTARRTVGVRKKEKKIEKQAKTPLCSIFPFYEPAQLDVSLSQHLSKWINLFGSLTLRLPRTEGTTA